MCIMTKKEIEKYRRLAYGEELFYSISGCLDFMATLHFDRFSATELKTLLNDWNECGGTLFWMSEKYASIKGQKSLL